MILKEKIEQKLINRNLKRETAYNSRIRMTGFTLLALLTFDLLMLFYTLLVSLKPIISSMFLLMVIVELLLFLLTLPRLKLSNRSFVFIFYIVAFSLPSIINLLYLSENLQVFEGVSIIIRLAMLLLLFSNIKMRFINDVLIFVNVLAMLSFATLLTSNESFSGLQQFSRRIKYAQSEIANEYAVISIDGGYSDKVIISNTYLGNKVTSIRDKAFHNINTGKPIKSLHIPSNINKVFTDAFSSCNGPLDIIVDSRNVDFNTSLQKCQNIKSLRFTNGVDNKYDFSFLEGTNNFEVFIPSADTQNFVGDPYLSPRLVPITDKNEIYINFYNGDILLSTTTYQLEYGSIKVYAPEYPVMSPDNKAYFRGWYDNPQFSGEPLTFPREIDVNSKFYAKFIDSYRLNYYINDVLDSTVYYHSEMSAFQLKSYSATGYNFFGWYSDNTYANKVNDVFNPATAKDVSLYGYTTLKEYDINYFNTKGMVNNNPLKYTIEDEINLINLSYDGYHFDGWFDQEIGGNKIEKINKQIGTINLYAQWSLIDYTVTYNLGYDNPSFENERSYNIENGVLADAPLRDHYSFTGWYTGDGTKVEQLVGRHGNLELFAYWDPLVYTIEYDPVYSELANQLIGFVDRYDVEDGLLTFGTLSKNGYRFDGWCLEGESDIITDYNAANGGNIKLIAQWSIINYPVIYNFGSDLPYVDPAETAYLPNTYHINGGLIPVGPEIPHYQFIGWYDAPVTIAGVGTANKITTFAGIYQDNPTDVLNLYAHYIPCIYSISYDLSDYVGTIHEGADTSQFATTYTVVSGLPSLSSIQLTYKGYAVYDWEVVGLSDPDDGDKVYFSELTEDQYDDLVLKPKSWEAATYTINYYNYSNTNGVDYISDADFTDPLFKSTYRSGEDISFGAKPVRYGYQFDRWRIKNLETGAIEYINYANTDEEINGFTHDYSSTYGNVEIYAEWTAITYSLYLPPNGLIYFNGPDSDIFTVYRYFYNRHGTEILCFNFDENNYFSDVIIENYIDTGLITDLSDLTGLKAEITFEIEVGGTKVTKPEDLKGIQLPIGDTIYNSTSFLVTFK